MFRLCVYGANIILQLLYWFLGQNSKKYILVYSYHANFVLKQLTPLNKGQKKMINKFLLLASQKGEKSLKSQFEVNFASQKKSKKNLARPNTG